MMQACLLGLKQSWVCTFFFLEDNEWLLIADVGWEKIETLFRGGSIKIDTF